MTKAPGPQGVAIIIGGLGQGGSERQLYLFLAHCDRARWDPVVYVSGGLGYWDARIRELDVPVVPLRGSPFTKLRQFRSAVAAQRAACFFSWSSYTNGFALALGGLRVRRIGSFRNAGLSDLPDRMRLVWKWMSLKSISVAVCNSRETQAVIQRVAGPGVGALFIPNAVEVLPPERVQAFRRHWRGVLGLDDNAILVIGVGRLTPQKCFARFIDVIAQAGCKDVVHAVIAGRDCGCRRALEAQVARLGLRDTVRLIGAVPDARELLCAGDIYLLSSDYEGMPNVVLEAMAAGVPCVATRVNGVGDLIRSGETGFLAGFDAADLARHVSRLAGDAALRRDIGNRVRALVERSYGPGHVFPRLWAVCGGESAAVSHGADPAASQLYSTTEGALPNASDRYSHGQSDPAPPAPFRPRSRPGAVVGASQRRHHRADLQ